MPKNVTLIPSAKRLMHSLRDIGYSFPTAVADLVDNSIEASATEIRVDLVFEGADSWVRISDNGVGMTSDTIDEAFRYGTRRAYVDNSLSRFGLGLKTASFSQCQCLTVASRAKGKNARLEIRRWDLSYIGDVDSWDALELNAKECRTDCIAPLSNSHGTVVFWEKIDRMLNYKDPAGWNAREGLARLCRDLEQHLAMVFHRFISGEAKRKLPLSIHVNNNLVSPWDPFARNENKTMALEPQELVTKHENSNFIVSVQPFILPNEASFSSTRAHAAASGPRKWNFQQGFYIYRGERMIQSGGWNRLRTFDEHTKLARIAIDFSPNADEAFMINVSKMRVQLPEDIRNQLTAIASAVARKANAVYRQRDGIPNASPPQIKGKGKNTLGGNLGGRRQGIGDGGGGDGFIRDKNISVEDLAKIVIRVLKEELAGNTELLDKILERLGARSKEFIIQSGGSD